MKLQVLLKQMHACPEAVEWVGDRDLAKAWAECERADWMIWFAAKKADRKLVVLAECACARPALKYVPEGEDWPRIAIETAEAWARGEATIEQVRTAADAAYAADKALAVYAAYDAAVYAVIAQYAACGASDAARVKALADMADIVRKIIPVEKLKEVSHAE